MDAIRGKAVIVVVAVVISMLIGGTHASAKKEPVLPTTFPRGFAVPIDRDLAVPVIGFGGSEHRHLKHNPVIFLHGNNDTLTPEQAGVAWSHYHLRKQALEARVVLGKPAHALLTAVEHASARALGRVGARL